MYDGENRNMRVFSNLRAGHVSDGPFFSVLPEKNGEKRGAGLRFGACCGCSLGKPLFSVTANTHSHPTGTMVRAACYGASDLQVAAFERLRSISFAFRICGTVRIRRSSVGADAHIDPYKGYADGVSRPFPRTPPAPSWPRPWHRRGGRKASSQNSAQRTAQHTGTRHGSRSFA